MFQTSSHNIIFLNIYYNLQISSLNKYLKPSLPSLQMDPGVR